MTTTRRPSASITTRLTLSFALVASLVVGFVATELYLRVRDAQDRVATATLDQRWEDLRETARSSPRLTDVQRARVIVEHGDGPTAAFGTESGELLARTARAAKLHVRRTSAGHHQVHTRAARYDVRAGTPAAGWPLAVLAEDRGNDEEQRERLLVQIAVGSVAVVCFISLLAWWLARRALAPVELLRARARDLADADQPGLLPVPPGRDEVSRLATTLNDLLERRHAAVERERSFVADAGHELRTPLATLLAELELALERERTPDEYRTTIDVARREAERLADLARQLLLVGARAPRPRPQRLGLEAVLRETIARVDRASGRDVGVELEVPGDVVIDADRTLLELAITNLLDNALRHARSTVVVRVTRDADQVRMLVLDDGPGFAPDVREHAFERFARGVDERGHAGSGLGLSIVQALSVAHGWRADVVDPPGGGHGGAVELVVPTDGGTR